MLCPGLFHQRDHLSGDRGGTLIAAELHRAESIGFEAALDCGFDQPRALRVRLKPGVVGQIVATRV